MADESAIESALESAFGNNPAPAPAAPKPAAAAPAPAPAPVEAAEPDDEPVEAADDADEADAEPVEAKEADPAPEVEPEFEIEVNGVREVVRGKDAIIAELQKARDYHHKSEANARARDSLIAQAQQQQVLAQFQQIAMADITAIQAIDGQLEQYNRIDWATAFDTDPFNALKLKEQRDQLREVKAQRIQEFQAKREQFQASQAQAARQVFASEQAALLSKLPEWRDSEVATKEQKSIATQLATSYGFNEAEIAGLVDHRMLLVARDAMKWRELQASKPAVQKQVRQAPPVVKPGVAQSAELKAKAEGREIFKEIRKAGRQNDHRAQERLVEKALGRAFK